MRALERAQVLVVYVAMVVYLVAVVAVLRKTVEAVRGVRRFLLAAAVVVVVARLPHKYSQGLKTAVRQKAAV